MRLSVVLGLAAACCLVFDGVAASPLSALGTSQLGALLQEDEDSLDVTKVPPPEQVDFASEISSASGVGSVMAQSGLGHMVGENDKVRFDTHKKFVQQEDTRDLEIANLNGVLEMMKRELQADDDKIQALEDKERESLGKVREAYKGKLAAVQADHDAHLQSIKREAAIKVKRVRVEGDQALSQSSHTSESALKQLEDESQQQLTQLQTNIASLTDRLKDANARAEKIYAANREAWKAKREEELKQHGVRGQVEQASAELAKAKAQHEETKGKKADLKQHLKATAKDKLLAAARLKNLKGQEDALKAKEAALHKENTDLQRQVGEVKLTQAENAPAASNVKQALAKSKVQAMEQAKAKAEQEMRDFAASELAKAQATIATLKRQLAGRERREARAEQELLQQESNVQAERKEADDALAKADRDLDEAKHQVQLEQAEANNAVREIVNEALKKSAAMKEEARGDGWEAGKQEAAAEQAALEKKNDELRKEEEEAQKLRDEFKERTEKKVEEHAADAKERLGKEKAQLAEDLTKQAEQTVAEAKLNSEKEIEDAKEAMHSAAKKVESEDSELERLAKENEQLKKDLEAIKTEEIRQKQEWTAQQAVPPTF